MASGQWMVESACKGLMQQRFQGAGMRWSADGFHHRPFLGKGREFTMNLVGDKLSKPREVEISFQRNYPLELSVVMPCLNEAETLAICIRKVQESLSQNHV